MHCIGAAATLCARRIAMQPIISSLILKNEGHLLQAKLNAKFGVVRPRQYWQKAHETETTPPPALRLTTIILIWLSTRTGHKNFRCHLLRLHRIWSDEDRFTVSISLSRIIKSLETSTQPFSDSRFFIKLFKTVFCIELYWIRASSGKQLLLLQKEIRATEQTSVAVVCYKWGDELCVLFHSICRLWKMKFAAWGIRALTKGGLQS